MTTTALPIPELTQFLADADETQLQSRDAALPSDPDLADAEEEEFAELWAADRGNQGA